MVSKKKITIEEIAQKANVSISTVSRVLSGKAAVSEAKKEAVEQAMKELNYQPNIFAQSLASGRSKMIGVITPTFRSPFFSAIMSSISNILEENGYAALFSEVIRNQEKEQEIIKYLLSRRVDGLIMLYSSCSDEVVVEIAKQVPLIFVGHQIQELPNSCIFIDNKEGAYRATKHLIDQGHRQIACITGRWRIIDDARNRLEGYKQALLDAGIQPDDRLIVEGDFNEKAGRLAVQSLILNGQSFTAIVAGNDRSAAGARLGLHRHNLRVPDDISIVGFDDDLGSAYTVPPLTTVRQPADEMGLAVAEGIVKLVKGEDFTPPLLDATLIVRESVAKNLSD